MPVVPRIDSPPTMPSRALSVFGAISSPPGMEISTSTSSARRCGAATSSMASRDHLARHRIDRGLAGRNGQARPRHGADPRAGPEATPEPARRGRTVETISAPCVTSGSSPASLTTPAAPRLRRLRWQARRRALRRPAAHLDGVGKLARDQRRDMPPWPPRRAGARRPAAAQLSAGVLRPWRPLTSS